MKLDELIKKREQYQTEGNILKEIEVLREILIETEKEYSLESDEYIKALNELGGTLKYVLAIVQFLKLMSIHNSP